MAPTSSRQMRSVAVSLGLVGTLALSLTACGSTARQVSRNCVDDFGQVVPETQCLVSPGPGSGTTTPRYRWYYGGSNTGGRITGGSYTAPPGYSSGSSGSKSQTGSVESGGFGGGKSGSTSSSGSSSSSGGKSGGSSGSSSSGGS